MKNERTKRVLIACTFACLVFAMTGALSSRPAAAASIKVKKEAALRVGEESVLKIESGSKDSIRYDIKKVAIKATKGRYFAKAKAKIQGRAGYLHTSELTISGLKKGKTVLRLMITGKEAKVKKKSNKISKYGKKFSCEKTITIDVKDPCSVTPDIVTYDPEARQNGIDSEGNYHLYLERGNDRFLLKDESRNVKSVTVTSSDEEVLCAEVDEEGAVAVSPRKPGNVTLTISLTLVYPYQASRRANITLNVSIEKGPGITSPEGAYTSWDELVEKELIKVNNDTIIGASKDALIGDLEIPEGIAAIGEQAFYEMEGLTSVTMPDTVITIGKWAFGSCASLVSVRLSRWIKSISSNAFTDCVLLSDIALPDELLAIGGGAFRNCESLTSITIPESVELIGDHCFKGTGITEIVVPETVTTIGEGAFDGIKEVIFSSSLPTELS